VVLFRANSGEQDLIVTFLTRELGLISALAKNARKSVKRFGGGLLSPGRAAYYFFRIRELSDLALVERGEFNPKAPLPPTQPMPQALAAFALELVRAFEAPRNPALLSFNLLLVFLGHLSEIETEDRPYLKSRSLTLAFTKLYMELAGFGPDFQGLAYSLEGAVAKAFSESSEPTDPPGDSLEGSLVMKLKTVKDLRIIPDFTADELNSAFDFYFALAARSSGKLFKSRKVLNRYLRDSNE
jgi:recombinational DNA repair protein (RecF pathway)